MLLDLRGRGRDVRCFVHGLEQWVIATLARFGVEAWAVPERVGIWTRDVDGAGGAAAVRHERIVDAQDLVDHRVELGVADARPQPGLQRRVGGQVRHDDADAQRNRAEVAAGPVAQHGDDLVVRERAVADVLAQQLRRHVRRVAVLVPARVDERPDDAEAP